MKIRVEMEGGEVREFEANRTAVGPDGSLQLSHFSQRENPVLDSEGRKLVEQNHRLVALIQRDLWRVAEITDPGKPEVMELVAPDGRKAAIN